MRILGRIVAIILAAILSVAILALNAASKVYSIFAAIFYIVLAICALMAIISQSWQPLAVLGVLFLISMAVFVGAAMLTGLLEGVRRRLC